MEAGAVSILVKFFLWCFGGVFAVATLAWWLFGRVGGPDLDRIETEEQANEVMRPDW